jgi:hypothetical protein
VSQGHLKKTSVRITGFLGQDLNLGTPAYRALVPPIRLQRLVGKLRQFTPQPVTMNCSVSTGTSLCELE